MGAEVEGTARIERAGMAGAEGMEGADMEGAEEAAGMEGVEGCNGRREGRTCENGVVGGRGKWMEG